MPSHLAMRFSVGALIVQATCVELLHSFCSLHFYNKSSRAHLSQVGDGTRIRRTLPTPVLTLDSKVVMVASGTVKARFNRQTSI